MTTVKAWVMRSGATVATVAAVASVATALGSAGTACACSCAPPRANPNPVVLEGMVQSARSVRQSDREWADGLVYTIRVTRIYGSTGTPAPRTVTLGVPDRSSAACGLSYRNGERVRLLVTKGRTGAAQWSTDLCTSLGISTVDVNRLPVSVPA